MRPFGLSDGGGRGRGCVAVPERQEDAVVLTFREAVSPRSCRP